MLFCAHVLEHSCLYTFWGFCGDDVTMRLETICSCNIIFMERNLCFCLGFCSVIALSVHPHIRLLIRTTVSVCSTVCRISAIQEQVDGLNISKPKARGSEKEKFSFKRNCRTLSLRTFRLHFYIVVVWIIYEFFCMIFLRLSQTFSGPSSADSEKKQ